MKKLVTNTSPYYIKEEKDGSYAKGMHSSDRLSFLVKWPQTKRIEMFKLSPSKDNRVYNDILGAIDNASLIRMGCLAHE